MNSVVLAFGGHARNRCFRASGDERLMLKAKPVASQVRALQAPAAEPVACSQQLLGLGFRIGGSEC